MQNIPHFRVIFLCLIIWNLAPPILSLFNINMNATHPIQLIGITALSVVLFAQMVRVETRTYFKYTWLTLGIATLAILVAVVGSMLQT